MTEKSVPSNLGFEKLERFLIVLESHPKGVNLTAGFSLIIGAIVICCRVEGFGVLISMPFFATAGSLLGKPQITKQLLTYLRRRFLFRASDNGDREYETDADRSGRA